MEGKEKSTTATMMKMETKYVMTIPFPVMQY